MGKLPMPRQPRSHPSFPHRLMVRSPAAAYLGGVKIGEIMTPGVQCIRPETNLVEAARLMRQLDIGVLPVCENHSVIGMITDRDITIRAIADGRDPHTVAVREAMTPGVVSVDGELEVHAAVHIMRQVRVRRAPVTDSAGRMIGIVTLGDIAVEDGALGGEALHEIAMPVELVG